ncbi:hypothetical protein C8Q77DRAFT_21377 [Trametes polyzona]|nr:hypothetical protein C8Q77DRAFT_21377 [Trametes polyzona]
MDNTTMATIEDEIEETQRQIHRSSELIQSAFEGLSTLHNRVTEAAALRAQGRALGSGSGTSTIANGSSSSSRTGARNSMDPGHNAIVLASSSSPPIAIAGPAAPGTASTGRTSDSTLTDLRSALSISSDGVRDRVGELEELRRVITLHNQERERQAVIQRLLIDTTARMHAASDAVLFPTSPSMASSTGAEVSRNLPVSSLPARSRRQLLESSLRQRGGDDSATSIGAMVTARASLAAARRSQTARTADRSNNAATASPTSSSPSRTTAQGLSSTEPRMPPGIATRLSRIAQDIQQDITRISQQSETLMSWINEHRTRLDAGMGATILRPSQRSSDRSPSPTSANRTPRPSHANIAASAPAVSRGPAARSTMNALSGLNDALRTVNAGLARHGSSTTAESEEDNPVARRPRDTGRTTLGDLMDAQAPPTYPRGQRTRTGAQYEWASPPRSGDGPLSRSPRVGGPSSSTPQDDHDAVMEGMEETLSGMRETISRIRAARRSTEGRGRGENAHDDDEEVEPTETRGYRVRRRLNADGDEVEERVPMRVVRDFSWRRDFGRDDWDFGEDQEEAGRASASRSSGSSTNTRVWHNMSRESGTGDEDMVWQSALRRLDALSRASSTGNEAYRSRRGLSSNREDDDGPALDANGDEIGYPVNLGRRRSLSSRYDNDTTTSMSWSEYEHNRATMVARARAITSGQSGSGLGRTAVLPPPPPPPPATRAFSLVSTTQATPIPLWNDTNVRVRLSSGAPAPALDEAPTLARRREESRSRSSAAAEDAFWTFNYPLASPSLERPSATAADDLEQRERQQQQQQPVMWGSPTPFYPSPLPLPRVEEVSSLQARSRTFAGAKKVGRLPRRRALAGR